MAGSNQYSRVPPQPHSAAVLCSLRGLTSNRAIVYCCCRLPFGHLYHQHRRPPGLATWTVSPTRPRATVRPLSLDPAVHPHSCQYVCQRRAVTSAVLVPVSLHASLHLCIINNLTVKLLDQAHSTTCQCLWPSQASPHPQVHRPVT